MDKILHISPHAETVEVLDVCLNYGWGICRGDVCSVLAVHVHTFSLLQMGGNMTWHLHIPPQSFHFAFAEGWQQLLQLSWCVAAGLWGWTWGHSRVPSACMNPAYAAGSSCNKVITDDLKWKKPNPPKVLHLTYNEIIQQLYLVFRLFKPWL